GGGLRAVPDPARLVAAHVSRSRRHRSRLPSPRPARARASGRVVRRLGCRRAAVIEGSLKNVPLTDVFQIIAPGQKTGVLTVTRGLARARIYFQGGQIGYAHVTPGVHLGEILVRMDMLTAHEVQEILRRQHSENA